MNNTTPVLEKKNIYKFGFYLTFYLFTFFLLQSIIMTNHIDHMLRDLEKQVQEFAMVTRQ